MSHKISAVDAVYLLPIAETFQGKGWHGKGTPTEEFTTETVKKALFTHEFAEAGYMKPANKKKGAPLVFQPTGQRYAVATDNGLAVGPAVGDQYWTPQNAELFEIFREALSGSGYKICSVMTLDQRREFAIDAVGTHVKAGKRDVAPFVGCYRAFGGTSSLVFSGHTMVMQCHNTTSLFLREAKKSEDSLVYRNSKGLSERKDEIIRSISDAHGVNAEFARAMADADGLPMSVDDARAAYATLVSAKKPLLGEKGNRRTANRVKGLTDLFRRGKGNSGETVGDWFNGATEYFTFLSAGGDRDPNEIKVLPGQVAPDPKDKQFYTSEFGPARKTKQQLAATLFVKGKVDMSALESMIDNGKRLIKDADQKVLAESGFFN